MTTLIIYSTHDIAGAMCDSWFKLRPQKRKNLKNEYDSSIIIESI